MITRSLSSRKALEESEKATASNVESDIAVMSGGEQQEDLGQNREKDLSRMLKMILDRLNKLELESIKHRRTFLLLRKRQNRGSKL